MKFPKTKLKGLVLKKIRPKRLAAVLVIGLVILFWASRGGRDENKIKTAAVVKKPIQSQVVASGIVQSPQTASLRFLTSGKIAYINVQKGQYVRKGEIIASLDARELEKRLQQDLNRYFKTRLDFDETQESQEDKIITDSLKRIAQKVQADLDNTVIEVEIRDLAIQFSKLTSPIDGFILEDPLFFPSSNVLPSDTIATVASLRNAKFVAEVDETEIAKVKTAQKVQITLESFPEKPLDSSVESISPKAITTSAGATAFEVPLKLPTKDDLRLGMNGEAMIIVKEIQEALVIPVDTLFDEEFVWVKIGKDFQKRQVARGIQSDLETQITSGLSEGEELVTSGFEEIGKKSLIQKIIALLT